MREFKSYFTMDELQLICQKLRLPFNGIKPELIERIIDCVSTEEISDDKNSNTTTLRMRILPIQTLEQKPPIQSSDQVLPNQPFDEILPIQSLKQIPEVTNSTPILNQSWTHKLTKIFHVAVFAVGLFGGIYAFLQIFGSVENVEIPVKRSWFF